MSTLSISTPRTTTSSDVDARFDALVRSAVPAQRRGTLGEPAEVEFETVFDLDYGQPLEAPAPTVRPSRTARSPRAARRIRRVSQVEPQRVAPRRVRLTRRGRLVAVVVFLGAALALMTALGGWATASLSGGTPEPVRVIEVAPGDTLYDIAADLAQPGEIRAMVHRIQELNSLPGASIEEGQKLAVPRG
jgi:hypothetical protein